VSTSQAARTGSAVDSALRQAGASPTTSRQLALVTATETASAALTWAELDARSARLADGLADAVRSAGSGLWVIELDADKALPALELVIAALRTDIPLILQDRSASDDEQQAVRAELHRAGLSVMAAVPTPGRSLALTAHPAPDAESSGRAPCRALPADSLVLASGGTTGRPKLIIDTTLRLSGSRPRWLRVTSRLNWRNEQTQLVSGRLHHAAPLTFFIQGLADGNRLLVPARFAGPSAVQLIEQYRAHWLQATPFQLQRMAAWLRRHPADLQSLRGVLHMSAPCPPPVKRFWIDQVGPSRVFEIYGATEGIGLTVATGDEWLSKPGTVGCGFCTQLRILSENMSRLAAGSVGFVFLRSLQPPRPGSGYLRGGGDLRVSPDGFRSVGDHGYLDEDGYLFLSPRRVDLMNVGGENVYPAELEDVLLRCAGVADAAVVGVPDERLGTRPLAFVACWPDAGLSEREIIAYCRQHMTAFKLPKRVIMVDEIARTAGGKIDRRRLAVLAELPPVQDALRQSRHR
jgi:bile acid-coenzyme A ligase